MYAKTIHLKTDGEGSVIDLTRHIESAVTESGVKDGLLNVFVNGSTAAVTTIEYEDGVLRDLVQSLSILAPDNHHYLHDARWGDGNGRSHIKSAIVGPSITIPIHEGVIATGTWQQVVLLELDVRQTRERTVIISVLS